jgi:hypothetical protein
MTDEYSVSISMDDDTVNTLIDGNFKLYAFRAVEGPNSGKPVVWRVCDDILNTITIDWTVQYAAFISTVKNQAGTVITSHSDKPITIGQKLLIDASGHTSVAGGVTGTITIDDEYSKGYTCGISEFANGVFSPLCSFDVLPAFSDMITPIQMVALMFATQPIKTATIWEQAVGPGIVLDVTNYESKVRNVTYSIAGGWKPETQDGIIPFKSGDNINPLLVNPASTRFLALTYMRQNKVLL